MSQRMLFFTLLRLCHQISTPVCRLRMRIPCTCIYSTLPLRAILHRIEREPDYPGAIKVVRYSFPQSKAIHTQTALKMKNENLLTKFCEKPTVYMP